MRQRGSMRDSEACVFFISGEFRRDIEIEHWMNEVTLAFRDFAQCADCMLSDFDNRHYS